MSSPLFISGRILLCSLFFGGLLIALTTPLHATESSSFQTGKQAFEQGDFTAAFKTFHSLIKQQPGDPEIDF